MIILKRNDGFALNISNAISLYNHPKGLVVETADNEYFITSIPSLEHLESIINAPEERKAIEVIYCHFSAWPATKVPR